MPTALPDSLTILGTRVTYQQLLTLVVAVVLVYLLHAFLVRTRPGRELRAVAQDTEMAALMGIPVERDISDRNGALDRTRRGSRCVRLLHSSR